MYIGIPYPPVNQHHGNHEIGPQSPLPLPTDSSSQQLHHSRPLQPPNLSHSYTALKQLIQTIASWLQTVDAKFAAWQNTTFPHSLPFHMDNPPLINPEEITQGTTHHLPSEHQLSPSVPSPHSPYSVNPSSIPWNRQTPVEAHRPIREYIAALNPPSPPYQSNQPSPTPHSTPQQRTHTPANKYSSADIPPQHPRSSTNPPPARQQYVLVHSPSPNRPPTLPLQPATNRFHPNILTDSSLSTQPPDASATIHTLQPTLTTATTSNATTTLPDNKPQVQTPPVQQVNPATHITSQLPTQPTSIDWLSTQPHGAIPPILLNPSHYNSSLSPQSDQTSPTPLRHIPQLQHLT